ncbi:uncharacterized protein LOC129876849 [Solanum dulcamara]|uniref:uncharacterized protein LOC129876849 n=1 Tax=Solanum dulcamara TaxID=45834 RepID=UPI00248504F5|nr:uncharacterized protein LOC129876849 [Solanum dulcamara]
MKILVMEIDGLEQPKTSPNSPKVLAALGELPRQVLASFGKEKQVGHISVASKVRHRLHFMPRRYTQMSRSYCRRCSNGVGNSTCYEVLPSQSLCAMMFRSKLETLQTELWV